VHTAARNRVPGFLYNKGTTALDYYYYGNQSKAFVEIQTRAPDDLLGCTNNQFIFRHALPMLMPALTMLHFPAVHALVRSLRAHTRRHTSPTPFTFSVPAGSNNQPSDCIQASHHVRGTQNCRIPFLNWREKKTNRKSQRSFSWAKTGQEVINIVGTLGNRTNSELGHCKCLWPHHRQAINTSILQKRLREYKELTKQHRSTRAGLVEVHWDALHHSDLIWQRG
jgi:hypothetical protein